MLLFFCDAETLNKNQNGWSLVYIIMKMDRLLKDIATSMETKIITGKKVVLPKLVVNLGNYITKKKEIVSYLKKNKKNIVYIFVNHSIEKDKQKKRWITEKKIVGMK